MFPRSVRRTARSVVFRSWAMKNLRDAVAIGAGIMLAFETVSVREVKVEMKELKSIMKEDLNKEERLLKSDVKDLIKVEMKEIKEN
jgi:hypothetical protein